MNEIPSRGVPWRLILSWGLILAALAVGFGGNFAEMWHRWFPAWDRAGLGLYDRLVEGESYYTHSPLIPLVSLLISGLLIRHVKIVYRPAPVLGGVILGGSLLLHLLACHARVNFASGFAFIGVVAGLVALLWGRNALRVLWFPIVFLVFMVPLPEQTIADLNFRLKMYAAEYGVKAASALGVLVAQVKDQPNMVVLAGGKSLVVANVCNGLRTLISLLAFGALYAYVCRLRGLWRLGLFAMTLPVAAVANSARIVSLIVVADLVDVETATGWYHDFSGVLIFVLAFLMMFSLEGVILGVRRLVGWPARVLPLFAGRTRGAEDPPQWPWMVRRGNSAAGFTSGATLALVAAGAVFLNSTVPPALPEQLVEDAVPRRLLIGEVEYGSKDYPLDAQTLTILEFPSYVCREYAAPARTPLFFALIYSQDNRKGTHPPDLCLEGGGEGIIAKNDLHVGEIPGRGAVPVRELIVQDGPRQTYFVYTYRCGEHYTRSFWAQQMRIFLNGLLRRDASGALVRVSTPIDTTAEDARQRSFQMLRALIPHLDRNLP